MQYTIQRGDTLAAIASRFLGDPRRYADLARLNGIADPNKIYIGQVLTIPDPAGRAEVSPVEVTATKIPTASGGMGPSLPRVPQPSDPDYVWPLAPIEGTAKRDYTPAVIAGLILLWAMRDNLSRIFRF